jgi:methylated-DNA-[protein]-cysteine S-methyltransferase
MTTNNRDQADLFGDLLPINETHLRALRDRLAVDADSAGVLDVAYRTIDTPVGTLLLAATALGLIRVAFDSEGLDAVLGVLAADVSPRILNAPKRLDGAARELDE